MFKSGIKSQRIFIFLSIHSLYSTYLGPDQGVILFFWLLLIGVPTVDHHPFPIISSCHTNPLNIPLHCIHEPALLRSASRTSKCASNLVSSWHQKDMSAIYENKKMSKMIRGWSCMGWAWLDLTSVATSLCSKKRCCVHIYP